MKITKRQLQRIINEVWTSADDGAMATDNKMKDALRPRVEEMLKSIYLGGYAADGALSLWDTIENANIGDSKRVTEAMLYSIINMMEN